MTVTGNLIPFCGKGLDGFKDGLTYTYKLRKGVKWYTSEGEEYAEVKAQDFVTGLKHAADKKPMLFIWYKIQSKAWMLT